MAFADTSAQITPEEIQFKEELKPVNTELMSWDILRGEWMANNLANIAFNRPLTEKSFSEDFTVAEFVDFMPEDKRQNIQKIIEKNLNTSSQQGRVSTEQQWRVMERTFGKVRCTTTSGRTYGDPHISTFDGKSYSFQTVGEFVLSRSTKTSFEVQSRQKASSDDVSLNIAAAMNVNGDRVAFYTNEYPDNFQYEPVRVNGRVAYINSSSMQLPNGGVIRRKTNKSYVVSWPTGEQVMIDLRSSGSFKFMNINVEVPTCNAGEYEGLLGNANGQRNDDLDMGTGRLNDIGFTASDQEVFGGMSNEQSQRQREYLRYIASDFGSMYRVNGVTTLFDYGFGQSTAYFTDLFFPRNHRSISDLPANRRNRARRRCEDQGISPENMNACIFDVAYINIEPEPQRRIPRATEGVDFTPSSGSGRTPGTNPNGNVDGEVNGRPTAVGGEHNGKPVVLDSVPLDQKPQTIVKPEGEETLQTKPAVVKPVQEPNTEPVQKPATVKEPVVPASKPTPAPVTPKPAPKPVKKPAPKVTPAPAPKPAPRVTPKPAPKPAPRVTPKPKPKPAPRPAPRVTPKPVPKPAPRVTPKPKPAPKPAPKTTPRTSPKPAPKPAPRPAPSSGRR